MCIVSTACLVLDNDKLLNSAKTKAVLISINKKRQRLNADSLSLKDGALQMITSNKIVGVFVDNNLL